MSGGLGQTVGQGMGGSRGGMMGEVLGGAAGGLGEGFLGMGPLGSTLGTTGAGQSAQNYLGGTSLGKYLGLNPASPGGPLSSVAAGVTPTMTGQPGAFPAPGAPPVPIDPKTGQMIASLQTATPPAGAPPAGTPATTNVPSPTGAQPAQPSSLANNIAGTVATTAALGVTRPQSQQQQPGTPSAPRPAATPPSTPAATQPTVTNVPTPPPPPTPTPPLPPTSVQPASMPSGMPAMSVTPADLPSFANPAGARGMAGPPVSAATPSASSQLNQLLSMAGGSAAQQGQSGIPLGQGLSPSQSSALTYLLRMLGGT